jgi:phosphoglycerate dehydrogenase-like enzyme
MSFDMGPSRPPGLERLSRLGPLRYSFFGRPFSFYASCMKFRLLILPPQTDRTRDLARLIANAVGEADVVAAETEGDAKREISTADAAYGTLPPQILRHATRLRWLQAPQAAPPAGYYHADLIAHPVTVTNLRGIFADRIPAHILAYVLAFARGLHVYVRRQQQRHWDPDNPAPVVHLPGAIALIIGVGSIGAETARLCAAFGMRVIGVDPRRTGLIEGISELHEPDHLDRLLPLADFVILTVPHTPRTEGLFDFERFRRMKPAAFFINVGRGMTTRLEDLDRALREGVIAGAGLDVYEVEPLPEDHPLWASPNTLLTPHAASDGPSLDAARNDIIIENARHFAAGEPLINIVDKGEWC